MLTATFNSCRIASWLKPSTIPGRFVPDARSFESAYATLVIILARNTIKAHPFTIDPATG
jgi:hypothetical protein